MHDPGEQHHHGPHDHEHHEQCTHDHHEHTTHPHPQATAVSIEEHEGALVATCTLLFRSAREEAERDLTQRLEQLAQAIEDRGGVIGHIKAALTSTDTTTFSTVGTSVTLRRGTPAISAQVVAIILAIEASQIRELLTTMVNPPGDSA
jgi:hypothetical protein